MTSRPHQLTALEILAAYRRKDLSPIDVVEDLLAHITRWEPHLNALYAFDPEGARAAARASAERWDKGTPLGPLDGIPATIKDNIATKGVPIPLGTAATRLTPATEDAPPAARLHEAGAIIFSKTTMPDYGMLSSGLSSFHGITRNPWDLDMNPGGSSAGAGAAAAAGYGPLHIGTDIGGSVRLPACWCGIFTLKPSLGRIPIDPPYVGRIAGPMTRTVDDAALMMSVLSQPDARDTMSLPPAAIDWQARGTSLRGLRLGLMLDIGAGLQLDPEVRDVIVAAAQTFEAAGAIVKKTRPVLTREMLDGLDVFWRQRMRSHIALHPRLGCERSQPHGDRCRARVQPNDGDPPGGRPPILRCRLFAFACLACPQFSRSQRLTAQRSRTALRAHWLYGPMEYVGAASGLDQRGLQRVRFPHRPSNCWPPLRRSWRFAPFEGL